MKQSIESLMQKRLPLPGVAAWSARLPDRSMTGQCYTDWFTPKQAQNILGRLALAAESLAGHRLEPERLAWTFEHARIFLALRPDGACLALCVENRLEASTAALESVFQEFLALPP